MINQNKIITVWITKYALTRGIFVKKAIINETDNNTVDIIDKDIISWEQSQYYGEGKEWHRTMEGAIKRAKEMRDKKINSLKKQLEKLKNMKFE